ncbi:hypothetical protein F4825DRAFT_213656 [Nemania diffusa]|nr:hypothetical protein F4825DRAFT_213656 [Nemania diffusa]
MDTVVACCNKCSALLCTLPNLWIQIGQSYISPVIETKHSWEISSAGRVRPGKQGTIVDNCDVQEIICNQCCSILGTKCLGSAINYIIHKDQLLLRISSIQIKDSSNQCNKDPTIQRTLSLNNPPTDKQQPNNRDHKFSLCDNSNHGQAINGNHKLSPTLSIIDAQGMEQLDTTSYQAVAFSNQVVHRIDDEIRNLKNEMAQMMSRSSDNNTKTISLLDDVLSAKAEIKEIKRALQPLVARDHLEQESTSIRNAITEADTSLRSEYSHKWGGHQERFNLLEPKVESARQDLKGFQTLLKGTQTTAKTALEASQTNTEEILGLKAELQSLRQELSLERSYRPSSVTTAFTSHEMDILTSNITKIRHKASQVGTLQMELELLRRRVHRMETEITTQKEPTAHPQRRELQHSSLAKFKKRKVSTDGYV